MKKVFYKGDAKDELIRDKRIAVIGYGNQGRSQALNLRDGGYNVIIGNIEDEYKARAVSEGFHPVPIADAAKAADIMLILIPDEVIPDVFTRDIAPGLTEGKFVGFASGYNTFYGFVQPPVGVDIGLIAPRMGGSDVRTRFENGQGFPSLVAVDKDYSGKALDIAVAVAMAIGSTAGALNSSFREETLVDLFGEQLQGLTLYATQLAFDLLVEAGCSPEAVLLELYMSEEVSDDWKNVARIGLWKQLRGHSMASRYGQLTRGRSQLSVENRKVFQDLLDDIKTGKFARELALEQLTGYPTMQRLEDESLNHPINAAEEAVRTLFKMD